MDVEFVDDGLAEGFVETVADLGFCAGHVPLEGCGHGVHVVEDAEGEAGDHVAPVDDCCYEAARGEPEEGGHYGWWAVGVDVDGPAWWEVVGGWLGRWVAVLA